jgi:phage internal scaffolding protein
MRDPQKALYGDFSSVPDYQEAMNTVIHAQDQFNALPANIRKEFDHDPEKMLAFCSDPTNLEKMRELGLAKPEEKQAEPQKVEVVNPSPSPTDSGGNDSVES